MAKITAKQSVEENRRIWAEALRSGNYTQGKFRLTAIYDDKELDCCWGVACKLFDPPISTRRSHDRVIYEGQVAYPPDYVQKALGFDVAQVTNIGGLNDSGSTFSDIASMVEANG